MCDSSLLLTTHPNRRPLPSATASEETPSETARHGAGGTWTRGWRRSCDRCEIGRIYSLRTTDHTGKTSDSDDSVVYQNNARELESERARESLRGRRRRDRAHSGFRARAFNFVVHDSPTTLIASFVYQFFQYELHHGTCENALRVLFTGKKNQTHNFPNLARAHPHSREHETDIPGLELVGDAPVVQVVLQVSVTDAELETLQELRVVHQVQSVEDVEVPLFG